MRHPGADGDDGAFEHLVVRFLASLLRWFTVPVFGNVGVLDSPMFRDAEAFGCGAWQAGCFNVRRDPVMDYPGDFEHRDDGC